MKLTRRQAVVGAAAGAVGAGGIYELVDQLAGGSPSARHGDGAAASSTCSTGSGSSSVERDRGARAAAPPRGGDRAPDRVGRPTCATRRATLELAARRPRRATTRRRPPGSASPSRGGCRTSAASCPAQPRRLLPHDRRAGKPALLDARRFPSDPADTRARGERRRDPAPQRRARAHRRRARSASATRSSSTSRRSAAGSRAAASTASRRCRSRWRWRRGIPGADLIPETAELFLGFTSTQKAGDRARARSRTSRRSATSTSAAAATSATARTCTSRTSTRTSRRGTSTSTSTSASTTAFRPNLEVAQDTQTVRQGPKDVVDRRGRPPRLPQRRAGSATARRSRRRRASSATSSAADGTRLPEGHRDPDPRRLQHARQPVRVVGAAGRGGGDARRGRALRRLQPVERRLPPQPARDGRRAARAARSRSAARRAGRGSTRCCATTHRQNFLVPPRRHRSFPLAEL